MGRISWTVNPLRIILIVALFLTVASMSAPYASARGEASTLLQGLVHPVGVDVDIEGNIYFSEYGGEGAGALKCLLTDGRVVTVVSGLTTPTGVAVDSQGNVYFAESAPGTVKRLRVDSGLIEVILNDLPGAWGLEVDSVGNTYVVPKSVNASLLKISSGGDVTTLAEGLDVPYDVSVDGQGNIYFTEYVGTAGNGTLKKLPLGVGEPVTLLEGLMYPYAVAPDTEGNLYFTEKIGTLKKLSVGETEPTLMLQGLGRVYGLTVSSGGDVYYVTFGSPLGGAGAGTLNKLSFVPLPKKPSQLILTSSATAVDVDEALNITGKIEPGRIGYPVELTYTSPQGETTHKTVYSTLAGDFMDTFSPASIGVWAVSAEWSGDVEYEGAVSPSISVEVRGGGEFSFGVVEVAAISGVVAAVAVISAVLVLSTTRRRKAEEKKRRKKKGSR